MAVRFDTANDRLLATSGLPSGATWTITLWLYISVDRDDYSTFASINNSSPPPVAWLNTVSNGTSLGFDTQGGAMSSTYPATVGAWFRYGVAVEPSGAVRMYAGAATGSLTAYTADMATRIPTSPAQLWIGSDYSGTWFNGRVAAFKLWNVALSAAEVETEFTQYAVARTADLIRSHPFIDSTIDTSGNGHSLTAGSSPVSWEAGPDIPLGGSVEITIDPARAATRATRPALAHHTAVQVRDSRASTHAATAQVTQQHLLQVAAATSATGASRPDLTQTHPVTAHGARTTTRAATPALTQHTLLEVHLARAATTATTVDLTASLLIADTRAATAASRPVLGHASPVTVDGAQAATTAGTVEVDQQHTIAVTDARAAAAADRPLLVGDSDLIVHDTRAATTATGPLLAAPTILGVHHSRAVTTANTVLLEQTHPPLHVDNTRAETTASTATITGPDTLVLHASRAAAQASRVALAQQTTIAVLDGHATIAAHRVLLALTAATDPAAAPAAVLVAPMATTVHTHPTVGRIDHTPAAATVHVH